MALVDLYLQGVQAIVVSRELALTSEVSDGCDVSRLTHIGRIMVRVILGTTVETPTTPLT